VIVEAPRVSSRGGWVERAATLRFAGRAFDLRCEVPVGFADRSRDASGFLCAALPLAMRLHEDLEVRAPVCGALLARCEHIQSIYAAWDPALRQVAVRAHGSEGDLERGDTVGAFFSRGVDSVHLAARGRTDSALLTQLVFVDGIEPTHDGLVAAAEVAAASMMARELDLPLVVARTNIRELIDPLGGDWADSVAAALAFVAHAMAGWLGRAVIASADEYETIEPTGTGPLLDPLLGSERLALEHDSLAWSRLEKVAWIVDNAPSMLEHLKVCFRESRPDNCGRCGKCLLTMACLHHAGALEAARGFPDVIDLDAIDEMRMSSFKARLEWVRTAQVVGGPLAHAVHRRLRETRLQHPDPGAPWVQAKSMRDHRLNLVLSLMLDGELPS
jgi:hypothetical protein